MEPFMSDLWQTITLGIIEGITEFLPVSSTGHLLIAEHWLGERSELFNVAIQAGAILAVVFIYWRRLFTLFTGLNKPENRDYLAKLMVAFLITSLLGFIATRHGFKLAEAVSPIAWALILVGSPTMFAATGYELLKTRGEAANEDWMALAIGFVVSGIVAFIAVKWLLRYIQTHRFTLFAWYRIALGLALLLSNLR